MLETKLMPIHKGLLKGAKYRIGEIVDYRGGNESILCVVRGWDAYEWVTNTTTNGIPIDSEARTMILEVLDEPGTFYTGDEYDTTSDPAWDTGTLLIRSIE